MGKLKPHFNPTREPRVPGRKEAAVELLRLGVKQSEVARMVGVHRALVMRWRKAWWAKEGRLGAGFTGEPEPGLFIAPELRGLAGPVAVGTPGEEAAPDRVLDAPGPTTSPAEQAPLPFRR